ncbi:hypothetical protein Hypma_001242 [Hypsizygus marmoreus]|uniref:SWIM-type domain-containing protein n=1 Tax=Hypsizygus marmoreus TaxID=39966 RepID=A0A369JAS1_HYPMA|nr:hypothetical protein Hypma_001242 [Hypsizygus marmoreus]
MPLHPDDHSKRRTSYITVETPVSTRPLQHRTSYINQHDSLSTADRRHKRTRTSAGRADSGQGPVLSRSRSVPVLTESFDAPAVLSDQVSAAQDATTFDMLTDNVVIQSTDIPSAQSSVLLCTETDEAYWFALEKLGGIFRIDRNEFVLQNWDVRCESLEIGAYHHIIKLPHGPSEMGIACTCPQWKAHHICPHHRILHDHITELQTYPVLAPNPPPPAIFLCTTPFASSHIFSCVSSLGRYESGKRVIVSLQRDGRWHCQSCRFAEGCKHKAHAVTFAIEAGFISEFSENGLINEGTADIENTLMMHAGGRNDGLGERGCISHLPIPPPRWCSLPNEAAYAAPRPICIETHFCLDSTARCCCGMSIDSISDLDRLLSQATQPATVFGLTYRLEVTLEVIPCPACRHWRRLLGPDLSNLGVFNWNNSLLFTHELLNAFTNAFTASETPFSAFCLTVRRCYEDHSSTMSFCSDETFVRAWFAFVRLQELDSKMECPTCGPCPSLVIADGVSLATHVSKLTRNVKPPTWTDSQSETINSISSYKARRLAAIFQRDLRTIVNKFLDSTHSGSKELPESVVDLFKIESLYPDVASLIHLVVNEQTALHHRKNSRLLLRQLAAPDIVLQLVPYAAIELLKTLSATGSAPDWLQSLCPVFGTIVNAYRNEGTPLPHELRCVAKWLAGRAVDVYTRLAQHEPAEPTENLPRVPWYKTGTHYGLPAIRSRRAYSKLKYDARPVDLDAEEMGDCNKFYKTYSRNHLTGGILVLWCTHSICLGFHTIPVAEGRNDVFSAVYTRFRQAPQVIIYDFACQLAPYCFVREARYFRDTRFLIDELHAHDHTRCGQACFASNAMRYDERIRSANTSAAECGNKGIKRIRKTVSFMIHEHAVIFTKVFLDVWNRTAIRRMLET